MSGRVNIDVANYAYPAGAQPSLHAVFPQTAANGGAGEFYFYTETIGGYTVDTYGSFSPATVQLVAVPKPSTWRVMFLGFTGPGFASYVRSKTGQLPVTVASSSAAPLAASSGQGATMAMAIDGAVRRL
jgi:hypothetical protein